MYHYCNTIGWGLQTLTTIIQPTVSHKQPVIKMLLALLIHTYPNVISSYTMALVRQPFEFTLVYNPKLNYCKSGRILLKNLDL